MCNSDLNWSLTLHPLVWSCYVCEIQLGSFVSAVFHFGYNPPFFFLFLEYNTFENYTKSELHKNLQVKEMMRRLCQWVMGQVSIHQLTWYAHISIITIGASAWTYIQQHWKDLVSPFSRAWLPDLKVIGSLGEITNACSYHGFVESFLTGMQPCFQPVCPESEDCSGLEIGQGTVAFYWATDLSFLHNYYWFLCILYIKKCPCWLFIYHAPKNTVFY